MFGQFLVNRGLLGEEDLFEALERQSRMQLSFGRFAYQMGLMNLDQVMETLQAQSGSKLALRQHRDCPWISRA